MDGRCQSLDVYPGVVIRTLLAIAVLSAAPALLGQGAPELPPPPPLLPLEAPAAAVQERAPEPRPLIAHGRPSDLTVFASDSILTGDANTPTALKFFETTTLRSSITSNNSAVTGDLAGALRIEHFVNGPMTFSTNGTERMRIFGSGAVAVGSNSPAGRFHVTETAPMGWATVSDLSSTFTQDATYPYGAYAAIFRADYNVAAGKTVSGTVIGQHVQGSISGAGAGGYTVGQVIYSGSYGTATAAAATGSLVSLTGSIGSGIGVHVTDIPAPSAYAFYQDGADDLNYFAGKVGIGGVTNPQATLHVNSAPGFPRGIIVDYVATDGGASLLVGRKARGTPSAMLPVVYPDRIFTITPMAYDGTNFMVPSRIFFEVDGTVSTGNMPMAMGFTTGNVGEIERMRITSGGNVLIGTLLTDATYDPSYRLNVGGGAKFTGTVIGGNIQAKYQDVAEWVPTTETLSAGTVVVLDSLHANHVVASSRAYDTAVAGVISARPGLILGEEGDAKTLVATTGRVRVRVDASEHPIAIGDLLVSSGKPGTAMKSVPVELGGISLHRPGTVIGKALEPMSGGEGEILVLLSLQ